MKLLSYTGTRPGFAGLGNRLVRIRLNSPYSHTEVMFEPGDDCDEYMPDGTTEPDATGALWCASASATDRMPNWNELRNHRAGKTGGVRFKRIVVNPANWAVQPFPFVARDVAYWFGCVEGLAYDWRHILSFLGVVPNLIFGQGDDQYTCAEACAAGGSFKHAEIFDPHNLHLVIERINEVLRVSEPDPVWQR